MALLLVSAPLVAQDADAILKKVDDHYNHLSSLQARYTEHYTGMGMERSESGTLILKKPGRMRWTYDTPAGKVFILDGKSAWFYTPGDPQVQRVPAKQLDDLRSPLRLLLGHTQLKKELEQINVKPTNTGFAIVGVPKAGGVRMKSLSLETDRAGRIRSMTLEEPDGTRTAFSFDDIRENVAVENDAFTFKPPAGVMVVDGPPPM